LFERAADAHSTGNSGIGYQTSLQLALRRARVYIGGRSEERVNKAIEEMRKAAGAVHLDLQFLQIDLQNLKSVKAAAAAFSQKEPRLDILINNAGVRSCNVLSESNTKLIYGFQIMGVPFELTVDGYELQWQVNYLSPYLFVSELLPLMLKTASTSQSDRVRIVNLSSDMVTMLGPKHIQTQDVNMTNHQGMNVLL
jgi:NAD(P)-dependent dehydrogenase (short-subunit alcohol dehydrogenase family)